MTGTDMQELQQQVRSVLRPLLGEGIDAVPADQDLAAALEDRYDSLTAMECITAVEGEFGIEVDFVAHDVRHWFSTVGRMAQFVHDELEDRALIGGDR